MSERTFRAVVAAVLVGAIALAFVVVAAVLLQQGPRPSPGPSASASPTAPTPGPTAIEPPTPVPGPVFVAADVVSVGQISRGASSGRTLKLQFLEASADAIPNAAGSFQVTLTDHAGDGSTVAFAGTPSVIAPDSLGATVSLVAPNVLLVSIAASDPFNVELMTISGLGISASSTAAIGSMNAKLDGFTGALATGAASDVLASPGSVTASP
jgi:hypothetical protein